MRDPTTGDATQSCRSKWLPKGKDAAGRSAAAAQRGYARPQNGKRRALPSVSALGSSA